MTDRLGREELESILRDRYDAGLSPMEAIAYYLSEDPNGPQLSRTEAAEKMGTKPSPVSRYVSRAETKLED